MTTTVGSSGNGNFPSPWNSCAGTAGPSYFPAWCSSPARPTARSMRHKRRPRGGSGEGYGRRTASQPQGARDGAAWPMLTVDGSVHAASSWTSLQRSEAKALAADGGPIRTGFPWSQAGSVEVVDDILEHGLADRRGFMKLTGTALICLAADWLRAEPAALVAALRGGRVTSEFVDRVEEGLPRLRLLEAAHGGMRVRQLIGAELGIVADVLAGSAYTTEIARRLHGLAGELGRMAGWACFDAGLRAAAQRYWVAALHAAHAAGDRPLGANILKS